MVLKGSVNFGPRGSTALGFGGHAHRAFPIQKYYAATVYIPLPVSTYEGFKLTLTDSSGNEREKTVTNGGQGYTVEAGMLAIFQNLNVMDFE